MTKIEMSIQHSPFTHWFMDIQIFYTNVCILLYTVSKCMCDMASSQVVDDSIVITDETLLPVTRVDVGTWEAPTTRRDINVEVGPLTTYSSMNFLISPFRKYTDTCNTHVVSYMCITSVPMHVHYICRPDKYYIGEYLYIMCRIINI